MNVEKGLYYTKDHEWLRVEDEFAYIGITDFAQEQLGDIVYIELPEVDDEFDKDESFGSIESVKTAADLNMPVGGVVVEAKEDLNDEPELVNSDAFENWIIKIKINDQAELEELMGDAKYEEYISEEV